MLKVGETEEESRREKKKSALIEKHAGETAKRICTFTTIVHKDASIPKLVSDTGPILTYSWSGYQ